MRVFSDESGQGVTEYLLLLVVVVGVVFMFSKRALDRGLAEWQRANGVYDDIGLKIFDIEQDGCQQEAHLYKCLKYSPSRESRQSEKYETEIPEIVSLVRPLKIGLSSQIEIEEAIQIKVADLILPRVGGESSCEQFVHRSAVKEMNKILSSSQSIELVSPIRGPSSVFEGLVVVDGVELASSLVKQSLGVFKGAKRNADHVDWCQVAERHKRYKQANRNNNEDHFTN